MKKFIIKKLLMTPELSNLERKLLEKISASELSRIVAEHTQLLGEEQELIVARKCSEDAILRCTAMLSCPSKDILKKLVDREMYRALYSVACLEQLDSYSIGSLLDNNQINFPLRLKILLECNLDIFAFKRIQTAGDHLELLLYLKNRITAKIPADIVKFFLERNNKEEIEAMIAKGVAPEAWGILLEKTDWKLQTFERLKKEPLKLWAEEVGKHVFTKGTAQDRKTFMQIFCDKYKTEQIVLPHEVVSLLVANKEHQYLVEYFEAGGLLSAHSYQLVVSADVPEVIEAMKTWPISLRIKK